MNIPSNKQRKQIKKYFYLLVQEFIKDHQNINIKIIFENHLGTSKQGDTLGNTGWKKEGGGTTWQTINGIKVPGSEKIYPDKHNFTISFLNYYPDKERWRGTVVHEFTHLYLFFTIGDHDHDDSFYSYMEYFENWLDKNQGLTPRQDKSGDRSQYVGSNNDKNKKKCPECLYSVSYHSPQCSYNPNNPQKIAEFNRLRELLIQSSDLATLEKNWVIAKNNPLYSENKLKNIKKKLDELYQTQKSLFHNYSLTNSDLNGNRMDSIFWLGLASGGVILLVLIAYLLIESNQKVK